MAYFLGHPVFEMCWSL